MKEATEVKAPKVKVGTEEPKKAAVKTEGEVKEAKVRAPRASAETKYRLLDGVDETKFRGQRQIVIKSLKALGEGEFTAADIAPGAEAGGLQSKTPVLASVSYHLKGMVADGQIEAINPPVPVKEAAKPAETKTEEPVAA